jgi:hypothetical protein
MEQLGQTHAPQPDMEVRGKDPWGCYPGLRLEWDEEVPIPPKPQP